MKRLLSTICLIILITSFGIQPANAGVKFYGATSISDPSTGLDEIAGPGLGDGDLGLLILPATQDFCVYVLDDDANETTSAETPCPQYIQPITTPGTKTWVLTSSAATSVALTGDLTSTTLSRVLTTTEGVHDTGADAETLLDSGEAFPTDQYIGMTLYNVTDSVSWPTNVSSCVVTDNNGTTMTCILTGGTDNNWDVDDVWAVAPGPYQSGAIWYIGAATTILHPVTANYTAIYYSTGANLVSVDPQTTGMTITLNGSAIAGAGYELDSESAAGDFICIQNQSATVGVTLGRSGAWTDGGAS